MDYEQSQRFAWWAAQTIIHSTWLQARWMKWWRPHCNSFWFIRRLLTRNGRDSKNKRLCWADINQIILLSCVGATLCNKQGSNKATAQLHRNSKTRPTECGHRWSQAIWKKYHIDNVVAKKNNPNQMQICGKRWNHTTSGGGLKKIPAFHMVFPLQCK